MIRIKVKGRIRIRIKVTSRIRIRISLQIRNQNVWNMSLFEHFFKGLSLYLEAKIRIWIRFKVKGRIRIRIRIKITSKIRIRITVTSKIRIRNTAVPYTVINIIKLNCFCWLPCTLQELSSSLVESKYGKCSIEARPHPAQEGEGGSALEKVCPARRWQGLQRDSYLSF